jgi:uracil-DNA glycosylase
MRWDERQAAMLRAMGIRLWQPVRGPAAVAVGLDAAEAVVDAAPPARVEAPAVPIVERSVALPAGAATLDWPALRDAVAACTACRLHEGRRQTVFGIGHPHGEWMIVGEAPGEQEDQQGEPFVGKSGQLLDNMLRAIGLTRHEDEPARQVYIANTLKCRPPGNRNPAPDELAKCEPYLVRQLQLVRPKVIVAMGRFAVHSLLRSTEPIGRLRGRVHQYEGVPLIVTYHPAYLLRNPEDKARAWADLCLAVATANAATDAAANAAKNAATNAAANAAASATPSLPP